jgi:hypothetical protein
MRLKGTTTPECEKHVNTIDKVYKSFNAMNSVHFCSITFRSNQMHYFYYLKLKTIYRRRVDAGQNTRGTPTVNHDSGVGANGEKNHGTTAAQHT